MWICKWLQDGGSRSAEEQVTYHTCGDKLQTSRPDRKSRANLRGEINETINICAVAGSEFRISP